MEKENRIWDYYRPFLMKWSQALEVMPKFYEKYIEALLEIQKLPKDFQVGFIKGLAEGLEFPIEDNIKGALQSLDKYITWNIRLCREMADFYKTVAERIRKCDSIEDLIDLWNETQVWGEITAGKIKKGDIEWEDI